MMKRCFAALVVVVLSVGALAAPAEAATNRAVVVIDTGASVRRATITFAEPSITGIQALERAGANPVVRGYGGLGGAVCVIDGVGNSGDCLGSQFWAYYRAPAGSSSWTFSGMGADGTQVRNGDVEGWSWGNGRPPSQPPAPRPPSPPPPAPGAPAPSDDGSGGSSPPGSVEPSDPTGTTEPTETTASPADPGSPEVEAEGERNRDRDPDDEDAPDAQAAGFTGGDTGSDSGSPIGVLVAAAILAALVVTAVILARRRRRTVLTPD